METDKLIHKLFGKISEGRIVWHSFREVGENAPYLEFYYAEAMLYLLHDIQYDVYAFIEAGSPAEALHGYLSNPDRAADADDFMRKEANDEM